MAAGSIQTCELSSTAPYCTSPIAIQRTNATVKLSSVKSLVAGVLLVHQVQGKKPSHEKFATSHEKFAQLTEDVSKIIKAKGGIEAPFSFNEYMGSKAKAVTSALDKAVPLQDPEAVTEAMRYSLLQGGKRVRPALCIAACELVGGTEEAALATACAIEMIHTMSLIHNDLPCVDNDDTRRGMPSCHKKFGESIAVWAGDALLSYSFVHVARYTPKTVAAENLVRVIAFLGKATGAQGVVAGQAVDMGFDGDTTVSLDTLEYIHTRKTAALLESCAVCGAILGGATDYELGRLAKYARHLGLLFQVVDDILNVTPETPEQLGKAAGKDLVTDRVPYTKLLGMEGAKELAAHLNKKAKEQLSIFDEQKAAPLYGFADYFANRTNRLV